MGLDVFYPNLLQVERTLAAQRFLPYFCGVKGCKVEANDGE